MAPAKIQVFESKEVRLMPLRKEAPIQKDVKNEG
jgi:hypothetical protein